MENNLEAFPEGLSFVKKGEIEINFIPEAKDYEFELSGLNIRCGSLNDPRIETVKQRAKEQGLL